MTAKDKLLQNLRKEKKTKDTAPEMRDEWVRAIESLIKAIQRWLQPAQKEGLLTVDSSNVSLTESRLGSYVAPGLAITTPHGTKVEVSPLARIVVGSLGRVDLVSGKGKAMLIREAPGTWKIVLHRIGTIEKVDLTEETFYELLNELME